MKILSLSQPWLWSITDLEPPTRKEFENRTWPPPIADVKTRIALHAAKSFDDNGIRFFIEHGIDHPQRPEIYAKSAIVAVATIDFVIDCGVGDVAMEMEIRHVSPTQRRWVFGPYAWHLVDVRRLPTPIPWRGAQGMRHLPAETTAQIEEQLR